MSRVYNEEFQFDYKWKGLGDTIDGTASISATDKSEDTVEALTCAVDEIESGTVAVNYRFLGNGSNNDSNVLDVYAMRGSDHYTRVGTVTLTLGQCVYNSTYDIHDTAVISNEQWPTSIGVASPANDDAASISINTHGYSKILFLATTLNSTGIQVQKARL